MKKVLSLSLTTKILIGTIAGIIFGVIVGPWAANIKVIGDLWIRLLQMNVVLLIMTSMMTATGGSNTKGVGKMGALTIFLILVFSVSAAFLGLGLANIFKPGVGIQVIDPSQAVEPVKASSFAETILSFVSTNIVGSMAAGTMVPCMVFSVLFGIGMSRYVAETGNTVIRDAIIGANNALLNIIKMVMELAPIGIFCLLANVAGAIGFKIIIPMLTFLLALAVGDIIQFLVYIPITCAICKVNPFKMPKKLAKMSIMAMTTTSSAICLPTKMEDEVTKLGVSRRVADFTGPITMAMNSTGAVQCYVMAIFFFSQTSGIQLSASQIALAIFFSVLMGTGNIAIPGVMVVIYTFLATSMGLPLDALALLIGIDWFSGVFRTLMNVDVDAMLGMIVSKALGDYDPDVYNEKKVVEYAAAGKTE